MQKYVHKNNSVFVEAAEITQADPISSHVWVKDHTPFKATLRQIRYIASVDKSLYPLWLIYHKSDTIEILINADFNDRYELFEEEHKTRKHMQDIISRITLDGMLSEMTLFISKPVVVEDKIYNLYLQVKCNGKCNVTGEDQRWSGRKWMLSKHMTDQEVVQTAFAAIMMVLEHEVRELFKYRGVSVLDPHYDTEKLVELRKQPDSIVERAKIIKTQMYPKKP